MRELIKNNVINSPILDQRALLINSAENQELFTSHTFLLKISTMFFFLPMGKIFICLIIQYMNTISFVFISYMQKGNQKSVQIKTC